MSTAQLSSILDSLRSGVIETSDLDWLEQLPSEEVLGELSNQYPVKFLQARGKDKWEIGLAQSCRRRHYRQCLLLTSERGRVTTLGMMTFLRVRQPKRTPDALEFISGGGFSLYRDADGWKLKLLRERTVKLPKESIERRGWVIG
jgi:hypothetical protein